MTRFQMQITILIPTYNEEKHIRSCLVSVLHKIDQDVLEILVVDGLSTDSTPQIIDEIARINPLVKRLDNHHRTVPYALNIGIRQARGNYILRLDAHSTFPEDYISNCKAAMMKSNADNVGGVVVTHQNGESLSARLVQQVSTHIFGVGNARFRLRPRAQFADTVPFGFFKKSVFQQIGFFDERLTRNQDYELNARITKRGAGIWLDPTIEAHYKNQSTMRGLLKQALVTGKWKIGRAHV